MVHLAHWAHLDARLDNVIGRAVTVEVGAAHTTKLSSSFGVGSCDGSEVVISATITAASELVVGTVLTGFGINDEVTASESVKNHVDETGAGNDGTFEYVSDDGSLNHQ